MKVSALKPLIRMSSVNESKKLLKKLFEKRSLSLEEYAALVCERDEEVRAFAAALADERRREFYKTDVFLRGLIEIGNVCKNDCFYCGIRRSNSACERYVLSPKEILDCCEKGNSLGFKTFVLQSGEGSMSVERICAVVGEIKRRFPQCAVTLSLGEYSRADYERMKNSGADRYLLRHETADREHYEKLHPESMSFEKRMDCLFALRELGFQVGCGFMVGSPGQTESCLAKDLKFVEEFSPDMCGIGPFLPQKDTPFASFPPGSAKDTIYLISLLRLIEPKLLLPATTALATALPNGREQALKAGANVVMPNLTPKTEREKYTLYNNKLSSGSEDAQNLSLLSKQVSAAGYTVSFSRGDRIK